MSKYLIDAKNEATGQTTEFMVRAGSDAEARQNANLEDGWQITAIEACPDLNDARGWSDLSNRRGHT